MYARIFFSGNTNLTEKEIKEKHLQKAIFKILQVSLKHKTQNPKNIFLDHDQRKQSIHQSFYECSKYG